MKKIGLLLLAVCVCLIADAQTTIDIFSTGPLGSFTTGASSNTTRTDNNIVAQAFVRRGYAVFDLSAIPASAVVTSVELRFNVATVSGGGGTGWVTRGHLGDLSTITAAGTLYTTMGLAPQVYSSTYGTTTGNKTLPTDPLAVTFVDTNIGRTVSMIWSTGTGRIYTITGETGAATTSGVHAPFLRVTYNCPDITSITASAPATPVCPNTTFSLTGAATGTIASYQWTGPLGFTSTLLNPTITGGLPSSGNYTLSVTDASGCRAAATTLVTVYPAPLTTISPVTLLAFCDGDSATLDVPGPAGSTYQWYDGTTPIVGATNQIYKTGVSGNYKVEVTDANGCTGITPVATPTVLLSTPPVSPAGPVLLCSGDNGLLTVNTNGVTSGITYQWQRDGVDIPGSVSSSHFVSVSGTYRCIVSVASASCSSPSTATVVDVNDYPTPVVAYSGSLLSTSSVFAQYQWFLNTVSIAGATNATYAPTTNGNYRVRVTDANGCTSFSAGYPVNTVGINDINSVAVRLYPNPVTATLQIAYATPVRVVVSTVDGRIVADEHSVNNVNMASYSAGIYVVTVYSPNGDRLLLQKVVKQ